METSQQYLILIVDDNPTNIKVLSGFLKENGFKVLVFRDSESTLQMVPKISPDLILLDVMMPEIDGFELCRRLKESPATQDIPVIFMTALSDTVDKVKGLTIGGVDYITKPIQYEEVLARINVHLRLYSLTKQLQESKQAAEAANFAKSEFLANMSHELRTPLNSILGFAQILQRSKTMTDEELDNIRIIYQSGSHLLTLIDDILDLAKIEAQKMELDPTDFPFPSFLRGVVEICRIRAQQKGISFTYQPTFQLPTTIHADEKRLRQVLINLLVNAIKFTNTGGVTFKVEVMGNGEWETRGTRRGLGPMGNGEEPNQIPIPNLHSSIQNPKSKIVRLNFDRLSYRADSELVELHAEVQNWKIRFQVEDTGVGMTSEQLEKIFLPFEQVGNTHYKAEGAGLGLAISQKLIQMMGSTLQVTSQPGVGSIFWMDLDLPVATALPQTAKLDQPSAAKPGQLDLQLAQQLPLRILLAEDNAVNQKVALHLLKLLGYRADVVQNGQEVISSLRRQSYDVVLMDVQMPEMDGLEATRRICQEWSKGSRPRIIAVTANAMQEDREECLAAGMNDYISKPIRLEALVQALRQCRALNAGVL